MDYTVIRSARRTVSVEIKPGGKVVVRAPRLMPNAVIRRFVEEHAAWIGNAVRRQLEKESALPFPLTGEDVAVLKKQAKKILPARTAYFAGQMGVPVPPVRITSARTRYGSCSPQNRISYSCFLMANDADAIDYVVVHELAHIRNKNHSRAFWAEVGSVLPDWKQRRKKLFMPVLAEEQRENAHAVR